MTHHFHGMFFLGGSDYTDAAFQLSWQVGVVGGIQASAYCSRETQEFQYFLTRTNS